MSQTMFKHVYKSQCVVNICGQHLDGRHELFIDEIIKTLETQTAYEIDSQSEDAEMADLESAIERNGIDESDEAETMSESDIVQFLAKKTKSEMADPKFSPYINRIKNSPELLKSLQVRVTISFRGIHRM